jgi:ribA/ribD-fused uncharacterized protein
MFQNKVDVIDSFSGHYSFLSNFHPSPIVYGGLVYPTVEHAFQAMKTSDHAMRRKISDASGPRVAKTLGRSVELRPDWDDIKLNVMRLFVTRKFTESTTLGTRLIATGDAELIEGNHWNDIFWGVCGGVGENHLGKILMEVRAAINKG